MKVLLQKPLISRRRLNIIVAMVMCFTLTSCQYSTPTWDLFEHTYLISRDRQRFVLMATSGLIRWPEGFIAQFPDGGVPIVMQERVSVWQFDPKTLAFFRLAELQKPVDIGSRIHWISIYGWDAEGNLYVSLQGNKGSTSDTPEVKHVFQIAPGSVAEVPSAPDVSASVQQEPEIDRKLWVDLSVPVVGVEKPMTISIKSRYEDSYRAMWEMAADGSVRRIGDRFKQR